MLSSGPGLLSPSHAGCTQFIGPVSTNRRASHSIAKSVLIGVQFLFYVALMMVTPSCCLPELLRFCSPLSLFSPSCLVFFSATFYVVPTSSSIVFIFVSCFSGSPTSASSYCGSGESRSQSGESAPVEVCVSWWKPSSQSPLDQGKSFPPSVEEALWHSVTLTKWPISAKDFASTHNMGLDVLQELAFLTFCQKRTKKIYIYIFLHMRTGRLCRQFGRKMWRSRGRPAFCSWRSLLQTTRRRFAARASTWCHLRPSPSVAESQCSVSKNHSSDQEKVTLHNIKHVKIMYFDVILYGHTSYEI